MSEYLRAVPGSFDESAFVNPKTGNFCFPKYRSPKTAIVKIKETTDYSDWYQVDLSPDEVWQVNSSFNHQLNFEHMEFELSSVEDVFDSIVKRAELFPKLLGLGEQLLPLASEPDDLTSDSIPGLPEGFKMFYEGDRAILDAGLLLTYPIEAGSPLEKLIRQETTERATIDQLKRICDRSQLPKGGKKEDLRERVLASNAAFDLLPVVKLNTRKLESLIDLITDIYIADIKQTIDKWHPLYFKAVWESAEDFCECNAARVKIQQILSSPYWLDRLVPM
jgi:hypothetical protein